ncbi:MAG: hypothetical protein ISN29_07280 [Gammaproteobacteria bacterium AqS3]|nr:hypothetical protein [Gammaproteobacteria bacterium AqS3]
MEIPSPIDTSDLSLEELKIVSEKAEKALDGCMARNEVLENRLEVLYKQLYGINIVGLFSAVTAAATKLNISMMLIISAGVFLSGTIIAATIALLGIIVQQPFPGSAWSDFENYRDVYDKSEAGLLRYSIDVCLYKIQIMVMVCEHKTKYFVYSLWTLITAIFLSLSAGASAFIFS